MTRQELLYSKKNDPELAKMISCGIQIVVQYVEEQLLLGKKPQGLIFWLKNIDEWKDKKEVSNTNDRTISDILDEIDRNNKKINKLNLEHVTGKE